MIHFHGSSDSIVPFDMSGGKAPPFMKLKGVEDSVRIWVKLNGCDATAKTEIISQKPDDLTVTRETYKNGKGPSEVVLITIKDGGHTWPGQAPPVMFIGKSVRSVSANDLLWDFFKQYALK